MWLNRATKFTFTGFINTQWINTLDWLRKASKEAAKNKSKLLLFNRIAKFAFIIYSLVDLCFYNNEQIHRIDTEKLPK